MRMGSNAETRHALFDVIASVAMLYQVDAVNTFKNQPKDRFADRGTIAGVGGSHVSAQSEAT